MSDTLRIAIIVWAAIGVIALVSFISRRESQRERDARESLRASLLAAVTEMATRLGLSAPQPVPRSTRPGYTVTGSLAGCSAELQAYGDYNVLEVELDVPALARDLSLGPWPEGRGAEDIHLGLVVESGHEAFDRNFCVGGPIEELDEKAAALDRSLLDVIAESHDDRYRLNVTASGLRLELTFVRGTDVITSEAYVELWRSAQTIVEHGIARDVFVSPRAS